MLGAISSFYNTQSVFIAGLTLVVAFALIMFASQTTRFHRYGRSFWSRLRLARSHSACCDLRRNGAVLLVGILVCLCWLRNDVRKRRRTGTVGKVYAVVGCLLFSMFIVYDTQLIVGVNKWGDPHRCALKHRCSIDSAFVVRAIALGLVLCGHLLVTPGRHTTPLCNRYQFTEDEYIWGALNLYIDIVQRTCRRALPRRLCTVSVAIFIQASDASEIRFFGARSCAVFILILSLTGVAASSVAAVAACWPV